MKTSTRISFGQKVSASEFSRELSRRVTAYFQSQGISRHAGPPMIAKSILGVTMWIASYIWLITRSSSSAIVGAYILQGLTQLYLAFNIAHDANHGAYASTKRLNRALGYVFDLVGISSYVWRLMHNDSHHSFVNIRGADSTLLSGSLFRFSPQERRRPIHRFQHLYAPIVYCLPTLDWVLRKDYRWLVLTKRFGNRTIRRHPRGEVILLFAGKSFYYGYMLVLPILVLLPRWEAVLLGFLLMHCCLGFAIALIFQPNHFIEGSAFPEPDEAGRIPNNYIRHILDTTADYARTNRLATWLLGGLNLHVIHHMFPGVCHTHYPALTRILKVTTEEYGLCYREYRSLAGAFLAHLRWLKRLGRSDECLQP